MKSFKQYVEEINQPETNRPYRFIYYGTGSGNVYGVSNAINIQMAMKEFLKTVVRTDAGDSSDAEYDKAEVEYYDGYVTVYYPGSMEGEFIAVDIQSNNPAVQKQIKALNLLKYADQYAN